MAITFNWGLSGTGGTSASVSAGASNPINVNDLLIAIVVPEDNGGPSPGAVVPPPGWAVLDNTQINFDGGAIPANAAIFYKIAGGSETGNYTFTYTNGTTSSWTLLDYSGVNTADPFTDYAGHTSSAWYGDKTIAPSVNANAGDELVNIWITKGGTNPYTVVDSSETVVANSNATNSNYPEIMVADQTVTSTGLTGPEVMTEAWGTTQQRGFSIALNASPVCFMPGTMVRTPNGDVKIETIARGDLVTTTDGRAEKVSWIGRQTISTLFSDPLRVLPIRIKANALGENVPSRDLLVSPDHAILVDDILIQAGALVNNHSIVREAEVPQKFTYYHIELDDHSLILAENTPAETFIDNVDRLAFDNWQEHEAVYPEGKPIVEMPYPRAKAHRQVPRAIRERLAERGMALDTLKVPSAA